MRLHVGRPSVRLSVTFRYRDHIGWNTSKIISRPNSLRPMLSLTPTWAIWCNGNTPKLGLNRGELELNYRGYIWADYNFNMCTYLFTLWRHGQAYWPLSSIVDSWLFLWSKGRCYETLNLKWNAWYFSAKRAQKCRTFSSTNKPTMKSSCSLGLYTASYYVQFQHFERSLMFIAQTMWVK